MIIALVTIIFLVPSSGISVYQPNLNKLKAGDESLTAGRYSPGPCLSVTVTTDKNEYNIGEPVEITIFVTNWGVETVYIEFPSTCLGDFNVKNESGQQIYRWGSDHGCFYIVVPRTIYVGQTIELFNEYWNQLDFYGDQVSPGSYKVKGCMESFYWEGSTLYPEKYGPPVTITID